MPLLRKNAFIITTFALKNELKAISTTIVPICDRIILKL